MILPGSQLFNLILLAIGMMCWGFWANTFRMTSKWRFELYYLDFAIGAFLAALLIGFTFGSLGWDGFALTDDLRIAGKREDAFAVAAGAVFNLGNMLILGALSVAGVTVAYIVGLGLMLTTGIVITWFTSPSGNATLLLMGAILIAGSTILLAVSSRLYSLERLAIRIREGKTRSTRKVVSVRGFFLAAIGGIVGGGFFPLVNQARQGDNGVGPYALGLFFAVGLLVSTLIFNLFFMNLPVQGQPLEMSAYLMGKAKSHWLGILGGVLWYIGLISLLVMARAEGQNIVRPIALRAFLLSAAALGGLLGVFKWKEFAGAEGRIRTFLTVALVLFAVGIAGLSLAAGFSEAG